MLAENDALRDDVAAGRRRLHVVVCRSVREATTASGVDKCSSWQTPLNWDVHPQREADHYLQKQLEGTRSILMSSADRTYRWATHAIIVSNTHALPAGINA